MAADTARQARPKARAAVVDHCLDCRSRTRAAGCRRRGVCPFDVDGPAEPGLAAAEAVPTGADVSLPVSAFADVGLIRSSGRIGYAA
jgi:hypothetical protein